ncbi:DinB family protein [Permianibacter aggregans]|uniref:Putative damage-inducible protein DinB n=1 Tax=Permianibacter aggregans TaxID=1510150 RepID=A0A4R6UQS2_9GAMM|nr:DinB family protein [Permianibacter aggregans]QGX40539.1 DUF664 domain-containing protein [Permianibacter aggregans]TDQ49312.1 putative damage-inducible protein DinB [Permianibacter aggregans]
MNDIQVLTRYKAWADNLFLSTVATVSDANLTAPQPIIFGSLIRTLHHAYAMDYVWQCHLLGKPHGLTSRNPEHCPSFDELASKQRQINEWFVDYANSATEQALNETQTFAFIGGGTGQMARREMLLHVVNHATYHRGHAAGMLYQMGVSPPTTDVPVFLRQHATSGE